MADYKKLSFVLDMPFAKQTNYILSRTIKASFDDAGYDVTDVKLTGKRGKSHIKVYNGEQLIAVGSLRYLLGEELWYYWGGECSEDICLWQCFFEMAPGVVPSRDVIYRERT